MFMWVYRKRLGNSGRGSRGLTTGDSFDSHSYRNRTGLILMHDRERDRTRPDISNVPEYEPALFVLETTYRGERHIVAQGVAFTDPEQVVINWRGNSSIELIDSVDALYEKFGSQPRVMWVHRDADVLTEAEPDELISNHSATSEP